jgi:peptide/nickel transport system substrate-binding protein
MSCAGWRAQGYGMDRRVVGFANIPGALSTSSGALLSETTIS